VDGGPGVGRWRMISRGRLRTESWYLCTVRAVPAQAARSERHVLCGRAGQNATSSSHQPRTATGTSLPRKVHTACDKADDQLFRRRARYTVP
jgi:hypothetical protein